MIFGVIQTYAKLSTSLNLERTFKMQRMCKGKVVNILGHRLKFKNLIQILVSIAGTDGL